MPRTDLDFRIHRIPSRPLSVIAQDEGAIDIEGHALIYDLVGASTDPPSIGAVPTGTSSAATAIVVRIAINDKTLRARAVIMYFHGCQELQTAYLRLVRRAKTFLENKALVLEHICREFPISMSRVFSPTKNYQDSTRCVYSFHVSGRLIEQ